MLAQNNEFRWDEGHTAALDKLKNLLTAAPACVGTPVTRQCDSSSYAVSAVLLQDGYMIEYASRALTETEKIYAQIEKEYYYWA